MGCSERKEGHSLLTIYTSSFICHQNINSIKTHVEPFQNENAITDTIIVYTAEDARTNVLTHAHTHAHTFIYHRIKT